MERRLLSDYESDLDRIAETLSPERIEAAAALASVPSLIRGFGHVKAANAAKAAGERERLTARLSEDPEAPKTLQAAE
jgi:indolepyruvate ferredoxin oxidoreductase